jgi:hypothetical protein
MNGQVFTDAQTAIGFARPALFSTYRTVFEEQYPAFDYARYIPVNEDGDMWDVGTVVTSMTGPIGKAEYISAKGFDIPNVGFQSSQGTSNFYLAGAGFGVTLQEVNRASRMGVNLPTKGASDARKVMEKFAYDRAMSGSTEKGFKGLLNSTTVPAASAPTGTWGTATPDQMQADVDAALTDVYTNTKETEIADTVLLPTTAFLVANRTKMTEYGGTVLKYLSENNAYTAITGQPLNIMPSRELETAGSGSSRRIVAYARNPGVLEFFMPGAPTFMPPHPISSLAYRVDGIMNVGQTEIYRPKAVSYRDGI